MTPQGVAVYEKARVLAVDDDREVRALLVRALGRKNIECDVAEDGLAAKAKLAQQNYLVLICDLRMPRYHGHRLVSELLENADHPEIIVITGVSEPKLFADLLERGVSDIMLKPFSYEYMAVKVESLIRRRPAIEFISAKQVAEDTYSTIESATASLRDQQDHLHENFQRTLHRLERQRDELESGYLDSLRVLASLLNRIGEFKSSHAARVEEICTYIAKKIMVSQAELRDLKVAALLHDLGQFGLPDALRAKPHWQLTGEERADFENYPLLGATLLSEIRGAGRVVEYVEGHAENYDGTGFPHGVAGQDISLGARILRIADGCDTFRIHSNSAESGSTADVAQHLNEQKGRHYDPALVPHALAYYLALQNAEREEQTAQIDVNDLEDGMVLAANVYDKAGRFLVRRGAVITIGLRDRLRNLLRNDTILVRVPNEDS